MKLIVGLGNPGRTYARSRHNIGFSVVESLAKAYRISLKKDNNTFSLSGKGKIEGQTVILGMPLTFMNLSGIAVSALLKRYKIGLPRPFFPGEHGLDKKGRGLDNLLAICDDLDLEFGRQKIRPSGSSGGHRGLGSIMDSLGSEDFSRLRIGIGRATPNLDTASYVLSAFTKKEREQFKYIIERATQCCRMWVEKGIKESMNIFNRKEGT